MADEELIDPKKRKRLQKCFEQGMKVANSGNFDYATEMFSHCVVEDPVNLLYLQNLIGNLQKKYENNKKGAAFAAIKTAGGKASLKKAVMQKDWHGVIKAGMEILKLNPWDNYALTEMAAACEADNLNAPECELYYLRSALDGNMKDPGVNRKAALALERQGQFDGAIACWRRVEEAKPGDEEARRMVGNLSVQKTIEHGGYSKAETTRDVRGARSGGKQTPSSGGSSSSVAATSTSPLLAQQRDEEPEEERLSPEEMLKREIQKNPGDVAPYRRLADLLFRADKLDAAEHVLTQALQASGGDALVQEQLEDVQVQVRRRKIEIADQRFAQTKTEESDQLRRQLRTELLKFEMDIFRQRTERNPANLAQWYELGYRLEKGGNFQEAIKAYQKARGDETRKSQTLMGLGRCFVHIKQYQLGMNHFKDAVVQIGRTDDELRKEALYLAGKLAMGLKDPESARNYLNELASLDFGYKDVAERLDKLNQSEHIE